VFACYFAYGSNMNPSRVRERGIAFHSAVGARLSGFALAFDKSSKDHAGVGHANLAFAPGSSVEGVLYWLESAAEITKMDPFESTPINYSREVVRVQLVAESQDTHATDSGLNGDGSSGLVSSWTYFANAAVRKPGLVPARSYMNHLLAGRPFLSRDYYRRLAEWPCEESH
jgi:hypothetical protein